MSSYYSISTIRGLLGEAVVMTTLFEAHIIEVDFTPSTYEQQTREDTDAVIQLVGETDQVPLSIKYQDAGRKYGAMGEIGVELYEVVATTGVKEYKAYYTSPSSKMIAVLQGEYLYLFSLGELRSYVDRLTAKPKVRGLSHAVKSQIENYRYCDTVSMYIDVQDFTSQAKVVIIPVRQDYLTTVALLSQQRLSIEALRDLDYGISLLRYVTTLTKGKHSRTIESMMRSIEDLTASFK